MGSRMKYTLFRLALILPLFSYIIYGLGYSRTLWVLALFIYLLTESKKRTNMKNKLSVILSEGTELMSKGTDKAGAYDLQAKGIIAWYDENNINILKEDLNTINKDFQTGVIQLGKGQRILIDTGHQIAGASKNFKGDVKSRSGLALKHGVFVINSDGLIDEDYRGTLGVILTNISSVPFEIRFNDRIAQFELRTGEDFEIEVVDKITDNESNRNGGFGSTGK